MRLPALCRGDLRAASASHASLSALTLLTVLSLAAGGTGEEAQGGDDETDDAELQRTIGQLAELALLGSAQAGRLYPESLDELHEATLDEAPFRVML